MKLKFTFLLLFLLLLSACGSPSTGDVESPPTDAPQDSPSPVPASPTSAPPTETPPAAASEPRLPADPQRVEFEAEDGQKLVGYYYPASVEPAPVMVMMHWADGTHCDWVAASLVQWLQNRGLSEKLGGNPACASAAVRFTLPLSEYPALPAGTSYAVFAFDYRGYGESGGGTINWDPDGWRKDAIAAVQKARTLDGVDPDRVATIGASIGADGAIDGCGAGCLGALSLSPGNYLGVSYDSAVAALGVENKPAWCVASKGDTEAFPTCESASGDNYQKFIYDKNAHGMSYFDDGFDPKITQVIFDFLQVVFGG